jgi:cyclopropane-fatty-acyl-phospholipid synthase
VLARILGDRRRVQRWRVFFLACAELFGYRGGSEWLVAHDRLEPRRR